jgi:hypothetical protein
LQVVSGAGPTGRIAEIYTLGKVIADSTNVVLVEVTHQGQSLVISKGEGP